VFDIELQNISKTYPGATVPAVNNINLAIKKGEILTLLGPSGCGKTTLLRIIAGFEKSDTGQLYLADQLVSSCDYWLPPERRSVGMVFQDYALFPHLNVKNNITFGYKGEDREERAREVLELVNLTGYEGRFPHELSGGQQQRVALARALNRKPVVVLLDEPFSNLDADLTMQMRVELQKILKEAGTTAIFVSHNQKDALSISDRIVVINEGVIQQIGTPREVYQYPDNIFVANFVGRSNLLTGVIGSDALSVQTDIGSFKCHHTHGHQPGEEVNISIRPDGLELAEDGAIKGVIKELIYTGEAYDAEVTVTGKSGRQYDLQTHIHPEREVNVGSTLKFKILPEFVAVIRH